MALIKEELLDEVPLNEAESLGNLSLLIKTEIEIDQPELVVLKNEDGNLVLPTDEIFLTNDPDYTNNKIKWEHDDSHSRNTLIKVEDLAEERESQFDVANIFLEHMGTCDDIHDIKEANATIFQCDLCPYQTKRKRDINQHKLIHQNPMFKCEKCSYITRRKSSLNQHMFHKHRNQNEEVILDKHALITHSNLNKVVAGSIKWHIFMQKEPNKETNFKCYNCSYATKSKACMKDHLLSKHNASKMIPHEDPSDNSREMKTQENPSNILQFQCGECGFAVNEASSLEDHIMSTHGNPNKKSEEKLFSCDMCPHKTKRKWHLKKHKLIHEDRTGLPMFKCEICPYKSMIEWALKRHVLHVHHKIEYQCDECSQVCKDKRALKNHISTKHDRVFKSNACSYTTKLRTDFDEHKKDLNAVEMFRCDECDFVSTWKQSLKDHIFGQHRNLGKMKLISCDLCPYQAETKHHMNDHKLTHMDPSGTRFKCDECTYESVRKYDIKRHRAKMHPINQME